MPLTLLIVVFIRISLPTLLNVIVLEKTKSGGREREREPYLGIVLCVVGASSHPTVGIFVFYESLVKAIN